MSLYLLDLTGPARYLPNLVLPLALAAAIIAVIVYLLRRASKRSGQMAVLVAQLWLARLAFVPLEVPGASPAPVYPTQSSGFATWIVGGFFGLGILVLFMVWTSRRPRRPS